jgi:2EXR family
MFELFQHLPLEVRREIWVLALPSPRTVEVHYDSRTGRFHASTAQPSLLHVCHESRQEMAQTHTAHFGTLGHVPTVWLNLAVDIVQVNWEALRLHVIAPRELDQIRHLGISLPARLLHRCDPPRMMSKMENFSCLKTISLVALLHPTPSRYRRHSTVLERLWRDYAMEREVETYGLAVDVLTFMRNYKTTHPGWNQPEMMFVWRGASGDEIHRFSRST